MSKSISQIKLKVQMSSLFGECHKSKSDTKFLPPPLKRGIGEFVIWALEFDLSLSFGLWNLTFKPAITSYCQFSKARLSFIFPFSEFPVDGGLVGEAQGEVVYGCVADMCGAEVESRAQGESRGSTAHAGSQGKVGEKAVFGSCADP